ncbi:hypothetical protein W97_06868 [Coniosporium apollinis CBS 100218]|uniref:CBM-cenC domain-containing protein n=1 Tax=Coniosporium apollinis (strain CBS 100218) TaxID=1168221 RepID=R7Z0J5_CONA1|nr:uncharacterized protein W97_06868 [Coniosporium apollinis CBS 100218]EON67725.1 hypothetical protein W97_06868 [Coniosporium apollinis CBS 100218]
MSAPTAKFSFISVPPVTTTVATVSSVTVVATVTPLVTTTETLTETIVETVEVTATVTAPAKRDVQVDKWAPGPLKRQPQLTNPATINIPATRLFPSTILSAACSCIKSGVSLKTVSVTATSTVSVTATAEIATITEFSEVTTTTTATATKLMTVPNPCPISPLINGGFDSGDLNGWHANTLWYDAQNTVQVLPGGAVGPNHLAVPLTVHSTFGLAFVQMQQEMKTCAGKTYDLSLRYFAERVEPNLYFRAMAGDKILVQRHMETEALAGFGSWITETSTFTATGASTTFEFQFVAGTYHVNTFHIDDVIITQSV